MEEVAIITGSSGNGIGRSTALTLAREKYSVVINYKNNRINAEEICRYINTNGGKAIAVKANIFSKLDCDMLISETVFNFGRIDVCIIGPGADWNAEQPECLNVENALQDVMQEISPIYSLIPGLISEMKKNKDGRIIAIASNKRFPSPAYSYNVAKNSRIEAMLGLVNPCWNNKIAVNVISPGPVDHIDSLSEAIGYVEAFPNEKVKVIPQDIAETIAFLCSEKGRYITGNVIELGF